MKSDAGRGQKRAADPRRAGVTVKSCLMWVLGMEATFSAQAECIFNH